MDIKKKLKYVPSSPGIYIMKGTKEKVIYVGKAKNLRNRLRSYFVKSASPDARKLKMIKEIRDFEYIVTQNELEALVLEANFIKRSKPRYNIILRDDKNYPYLRLTSNEDWPRLEVVRKYEKDGSVYFGPYIPAGAMWEMLKFIRRNFPLRTCKYNLKKPIRPCLQHQIKRCLAPCAETLRAQEDKNRYSETVNEVKRFLHGEKKTLLFNLSKKMQELSGKMQFEEAALIRDRIKAIEKARQYQRVISPELGDIDVIGIYREGAEASVFMLFVRNGMIIGQKGFILEKLGNIENTELITNFIEQFYLKEMPLPERIIIPFRAKLDTQRQWLNKKKGAKVELSGAKNKKDSEILKMASDNAYHTFAVHDKIKTSGTIKETTASLKKLLNLKTVLSRIEAIDVSNISGSEAVGALVIWENGKFIKDDYRLFKIKTVKGIDDFAMIGEVAGRHFKNLSEKEEKLPNLILIDGGRGQLTSVVKAMKKFALPIDLAAIAKAKHGKTKSELQKTDRIYLTGRADAILLEPSADATRLLQRIRDEAHRFAVNYHKKLRIKRVLESPLEKIKGIGKTRRLLLLRHFGSIDAIRKAPIEEIVSLKGMNKKVAGLLKESLATIDSCIDNVL
ncbi:MAG: excinuclease ABC subunit UvrC [Nitrospirota bacterium]